MTKRVGCGDDLQKMLIWISSLLGGNCSVGVGYWFGGGGMTWEGKTDLVIRGNLNGQRYRDAILEGPVRLFAGAMGPANMLFG